jgi:hypothetical protein
MSKQSHPDFLIKLILRAQVMRSADDQADKGFIMVVTTVLTVMMFSLLGAYLILTDMSKSATSAYVDSNNTFIAAESGMNTRATDIREKFIDYAKPSGTAPKRYLSSSSSVNLGTISTTIGGKTYVGYKPTNEHILQMMAQCIKGTVSGDKGDGDFKCYGNKDAVFAALTATSTPEEKENNKNARYNSTSDWKDIQSGQGEERKRTSNYTSYSFVVDRTQYNNNQPPLLPIANGETYAGLNAQTFTYSVYASAVDNQSSIGSTNANTVLQMDFKTRVIPLFQFAAFYDGDLEIGSSSPMTISGWVHTNRNLYARPTSGSSGTIDFLSNVTAAGRIYNRVDAASSSAGYNPARVLKTGLTGDCSTSSNCNSFPAYDSSVTTPLTSTQIDVFGGRVKDGASSNPATVLSPPDAGFLRKRNYQTNAIGEYYAKADLRLEMVPDRAVPFNFVSVKGGASTDTTNCSTTLPTAGSDPAWNYIPTDRGGQNHQCTQLNEGQLRSMQQPVLVLTRGNTEEEDRFCKPTTGIVDRTREIINYNAVTANSDVAGLSNANKDKVLRALQVAIVGSQGIIDYANVTSTRTLPTTVQTTFRNLLDDPTLGISGLTADQKTLISTAAPAAIAKARNSCFLPAVVQRVKRNETDSSFAQNFTDGTTANRKPGFYDRREGRWLSMLQTNIESLTVWNRDGRYVPFNNSLTDYDAATNANLLLSLNNGDSTAAPAISTSTTNIYGTNNLLFTTAAANSSKPTGSFEKLGLAATDNSEGGLGFHATVSDDLNGNGSVDPLKVDGTVSTNSSDVNVDTRSSTDATTDAGYDRFRIYKKNPDGTDWKDANNKKKIIDYIRIYKNANGTTNLRKSPYAFAVSGGRNLPNGFTFVTDQAVYVQGDYNTYTDGTASAKKPAAIMGDTITNLSNNCLSTETASGSVFTGQVNCGRTSGMSAASTTTVNAAYLSYTNQSVGNYPLAATPKVYSGGLNNYVRMVENWDTYTFVYRGSLVSLGSPVEFSGAYSNATGLSGYYTIPNRDFGFDTDFNTFDQLPPLSPRAVYLQQEVFKRRF